MALHVTVSSSIEVIASTPDCAICGTSKSWGVELHAGDTACA
jgi:hypothetical protein